MSWSWWWLSAFYERIREINCGALALTLSKGHHFRIIAYANPYVYAYA